MKRSIDSKIVQNILSNNGDEEPRHSKVILVERDSKPLGIPLVNAALIATKSYTEEMDLSDNYTQANTFIQANARNKLDMIGKQMKYLQEMMTDVFVDTKMDNELHNVACNFVKKPGHVYHLYERDSGQRYFGMISPEEWQEPPPHQYLGSWRLEADQSWTSAMPGQRGRYQGLDYLKDVFSVTGMPNLVGSIKD